MWNPEDDVLLSDGHGFMVTAGRYDEHIQHALETREVIFFTVPLKQI